MLDSGQQQEFIAETVERQAEAQTEAVEKLKTQLCAGVTGTACDTLVAEEIASQEALAARTDGVLMVVNGAFSIVSSAALSSTCETALGCVASYALLAYGADQISAGATAIWTGEGQVSLGAQALMTLGLSADDAEMLYGLAVAGLEGAALRQLIANPSKISVAYKALATKGGAGAVDDAVDASTPVGRRTGFDETGPDGIQSDGSGRQTPQTKNGGTQPVINQPATIGGRDYSGHALDQMRNRGVTPSIVENTISTGTRVPGNTPGTFEYVDKINGVNVVVNSSGRVVTVK